MQKKHRKNYIGIIFYVERFQRIDRQTNKLKIYKNV